MFSEVHQLILWNIGIEVDFKLTLITNVSSLTSPPTDWSALLGHIGPGQLLRHLLVPGHHDQVGVESAHQDGEDQPEQEEEESRTVELGEPAQGGGMVDLGEGKVGSRTKKKTNLEGDVEKKEHWCSVILLCRSAYIGEKDHRDGFAQA